MTTPEHSNTTSTTIIGDIYGPVLSGTFAAVTINNLPPPPASPPAFQVPYPLAPLVGRSADLAYLAELLLAEQPVALTPAIAGMGGVGKTMLAATFARQHQADFPGGIFWLNMEQPDSIAGQVAACAGPGGLDLAAYEQLSYEERILRTKTAWNGSVRRLLVFDNLEDPALLKQWQPTGSGSRVLITTRRDDWPRLVRRLRLSVLPRPQSIELLLGARAEDLGRTIAQLLSNLDDQREADTISDLLGDLPLALAIAAAFLRLSPSTTLRRYREQIEADPLASEYQIDATMREILAEAGLPTGRERGIIATFAFSYQQLNSDAPTDALALTMLHAAAYCAPAPIPQAVLWWVVDVASAVLWLVGNVASDEVETLPARRDAAIRRLRAIGLLAIEAEGEPPPVSVHRLIAAYLRSLLDGADIQRTLRVALTNAGLVAVNSGYPSQSAPLLAHFLHIAAQPHDDDAASDELYGALAKIHEQQNNYAEALPLYQRAIAIKETALGPLHPATATSLNNLAGLYHSTGNYAEALPLYQRALAIRETALGPQHPDTAGSLNNLAGLHYATGNYAEALPLIQRALAIKETALGPLHPATAISIGNLAELYHSTGNYAEALPLLQRALAICETALGPLHPSTATSLNNLAGLYKSTGNDAEALPLYQRALDIYEAALGPQHPSTQTIQNNLDDLRAAMTATD
jgi:tetratricopeptide (TPR) repeat protein